MRTLITLVEWSCSKVIINGRGPQILIKWLCAYKKIKEVSTLSLGRMVVHKKTINIRKPHISVEWSSAHERNKSMKSLIFGRMVV